MSRTERLERLAHPSHDPLPKKPGIYRVHMEGVPVLAYVGQSRDLRRRINELRGVYGDVMPFTDPHIAAPALWAWRQLPPHRPYTVSFASISGPAYWRQGFEDLVIAQARWETLRHPAGEEWWHTAYSPLTNFHKMPRGWRSSSSRSSGYRGGKVPFLAEDDLSKSAAAGGWDGFWDPEGGWGWAPSIAPVGDLSDPRDPIHDLGWGGHQWTPWNNAGTLHIDRAAQGLYRLRRDNATLLFIGQGNLFNAAKDAAREAKLMGEDRLFSYVAGSWTYHEQLELLTDLLGLYLWRTGGLPYAQYGGEENESAGSSNVKHYFTTSISFFLSQLLPAQPARPPELAIA